MSSWNMPESQPILAGLLPIRRNMSTHRLSEAGNLMSPRAHRLDPANRAMHLLANSKERIPWASYLMDDAEVRKIKNKGLRKYYREQNEKIEKFMEIDRLLDSSLTRNVIQSYGTTERRATVRGPTNGSANGGAADSHDGGLESDRRGSSLAGNVVSADDIDEESRRYELKEEAEQRAIQNAINVNFAANVVLLAAKIAVTLSTNSLSIVASLLDSTLDFLSGVIVLISNKLAQIRDRSKYPVGRSRLEPLGVLVFSVVMIVSFLQVALEGVQRLAASPKHQPPPTMLSPTIAATMAAVVVVKGLCWLWCRTSKSASVQALAQDAQSDVIFNFFSIVFPILGSPAVFDQWWLDPLGAVLISVYILVQWALTSSEHIRNLAGRAADAGDVEGVVYMAMRFSDFVGAITSVAAYHAGDKIVVELDVSLDERTSLKDSHDLGEALQFAIEHLDVVERAYVHLDYVKTRTNLHKTNGGFA